MIKKWLVVEALYYSRKAGERKLAKNSRPGVCWRETVYARVFADGQPS